MSYLQHLFIFKCANYVLNIFFYKLLHQSVINSQTLYIHEPSTINTKSNTKTISITFISVPPNLHQTSCPVSYYVDDISTGEKEKECGQRPDLSINLTHISLRASLDGAFEVVKVVSYCVKRKENNVLLKSSRNSRMQSLEMHYT